jgi:FkbM family methyltransferase
MLEKISCTYRNNGLTGLLRKTKRYFANRRARKESLIWFMKRIYINQPAPSAWVHGFKYYLHRNDPGISKELAVYHNHEPHATYLFKKCVREGMFEIDIGSNIGYYALLAAKLVGKKGKVLAIEPEPNNYRLLSMNIKTNNIQNIDSIQCAVSDKDGLVDFFVTEASNTNSLIPPPTGILKSVKSVQTYRLDTLITKYNYPNVDFIRMDIEGGEVIAINGMHKTLDRYKPIIFAELHCDAAGVGSIKEFISKLEKYGYTTCKLVDRDKDFSWIKIKTIPFKTSIIELRSGISKYRVASVFFK